MTIKPSTRDATSIDLKELSLLISELGYVTSVQEMKARFDLISNHADYKTIVAIIDGEIVGMAGLCKGLFYEMNGMYMRVLALIVKQDNRKQSIGKLLMAASESWAIEQGLQSVFINCGNRAERKDAHIFYEAIGYTVKSSGYIKNLY
jgi:N-acetylglutamate synthase-like GNAT family acetyltransferase